MSEILHPVCLDLIFREARTFNKWQNKPVDDVVLRELYDLVKMGPTTNNSQPGRYIFVKSKEAKEKLVPALSPGNQAKTMAAPVCVIIGYDLEYYEHLPRVSHNPQARDNAAKMPKDAIDRTALRNSSLQGAYLMIAARSLGLDCGAMSGFDNAKVDAAFFPEGRFKSNFLCNLGYGDRADMFPRLLRLSFDEVAKIV